MGRALGARVVKVGWLSEPRWKRRATQGSNYPHSEKRVVRGTRRLNLGRCTAAQRVFPGIGL